MQTAAERWGRRVPPEMGGAGARPTPDSAEHGKGPWSEVTRGTRSATTRRGPACGAGRSPRCQTSRASGKHGIAVGKREAQACTQGLEVRLQEDRVPTVGYWTSGSIAFADVQF